MHNDNDFEKGLEQHAPTLSEAERVLLWTELELKLGAQAPIPSPFMFNFIHTKAMASLLLILMLIVGGGGTALASDAARPGDLLFPVERALENARLKLATSNDSRNELRTRYTDERLSELREILEEESEDVSDDSVATTATTASSSTSTLPVTEQKIKGKKLKENGEARVGVAVHEILSFIKDSEMSNDERVRVLEKIFGEMDALALDMRIDDNNTREDEGDDHIEIRQDDNGEGRMEIRDGNERVRIEEKDGEVRVRTRTDDDSIRAEERTPLSSTESSSTAPIDYSFEAEADVFTDTTIIKVEWNDEVTFLETTARTKEDIIAEILKAFAVNRVTVLNALDFQVENRASRPEDSQVANDATQIDDEEDDSWEDEDEREDEDQDEDEGEDRDKGEDEDEREDHDEDQDEDEGEDD